MPKQNFICFTEALNIFKDVLKWILPIKSYEIPCHASSWTMTNISCQILWNTTDIFYVGESDASYFNAMLV